MKNAIFIYQGGSAVQIKGQVLKKGDKIELPSDFKRLNFELFQAKKVRANYKNIKIKKSKKKGEKK